MNELTGGQMLESVFLYDLLTLSAFSGPGAPENEHHVGLLSRRHVSEAEAAV